MCNVDEKLPFVMKNSLLSSFSSTRMQFQPLRTVQLVQPETLSLFYHNLLANQLQMWHVMTIMRLDVT